MPWDTWFIPAQSACHLLLCCTPAAGDLTDHCNVQIVAWVDKLAKASGTGPSTDETKWRHRAADAFVLHCIHDLLVSLAAFSGSSSGRGVMF